MSRVTFIFVVLLAITPRAQAQDNMAINIYDAFGKLENGMEFGWGFSAFIRYNGKTILFDGGKNAEILAKNATVLGVDLKEVDIAILSHRHPDHANGLDHLLSINPDVKLYLPLDDRLGVPHQWKMGPVPAELAEHLTNEERYYVGQDRVFDNPSGRFWGANIEFIGESVEVFSGAYLIATESDKLGEYSAYPPHEKEPRLSGLPELSLALATDQGAIVFTGCSHSGVEEITKATKRVLKSNVRMVTGGFHLMPYSNEYISALAKNMKTELGVRYVAPSHCTGMQALKILKEIFGTDYVFGGLGAEIKF